MKKLSLVIGVLMIFAFSTGILGASFSDVKSSQWYYTSVNTMADEGVVKGYGDGTFRPNSNITRAEFVALLAKASGDTYTGYHSGYADVASSEWYSNVIGWAANKNIVSGIGGNKFGPNRNITRQDMSCMICRYLNYKGVTLPAAATLYYRDANTISGYALESISTLFAYGSINGIGDNRFSPAGKATRAEGCQMLFNNTHRNVRQRCAIYAKNFEDFTYTTGGTSPASGFDNVGFVTYVYSQFGVTLSGDATSLRTAGTEVSKSDLNMGDLICFGGTTPLVGIYVGNDQFIIAVNANPAGVHLGSFSGSSYYYNNFVTARRLFNV